MNKYIDRIKTIRLSLLNLVNDLTVEQLNEIPAGFKNNIIWHLGHLTAAQQGVCYARAGLKPFVEEQYLVLYRPGTKPEAFVTGEEIDMIKDLLISSLDQFDLDLSANIFTNYTPWTSRYGVAMDNIQDALEFLLFHEGLHAGHITAMKKLVKN
ncbi:MAG: DinB family protein [Williamsia sp.]|nr:DinB family protein [Williamsia sp.]